MIRAAAAASLGAGLALVGRLFDTPSLYVPGLALLALGAGAALWVTLAARGAVLERLPGPATIEEEEPYPVRLELRPGLVPPPGGELRDPLLEAPLTLGGGTARTVRIDVRFARRGRRTLERGSLAMHDPLMLAVRELRAVGEAQELLVLPRVEPVLAPQAGGAAAAVLKGTAGRAGRDAGNARLDAGAAELDLDGLRPYREGTPASRIHWPAVARTGEMVERRLSGDADSAPLVVLDASRPESLEALDMAVRAAASLCVHLGRAGGCALLLPGDRRPSELTPDLAGWLPLHARLALVEPAGQRPPVSRVRRAGAVIWVTADASGRPPRELERAARGGAWIVSPSPPAHATAAFAVAGCHGYRLARGTRDGVRERAA